MVPIIEAWLRRRRSQRSNQGRESSHLGQLLFDQTLISTQSQRAHYFTFSLYPKNFHFIPPSYCFVSLFAAKDIICKSCAAFTTHPSIVRTALAVAHCISRVLNSSEEIALVSHDIIAMQFIEMISDQSTQLQCTIYLVHNSLTSSSWCQLQMQCVCQLQIQVPAFAHKKDFTASLSTHLPPSLQS